VNAYTVALAHEDANYARILDDGAINLVDGSPLAWVAKRHDPAVAEGPVRGPSLFRTVLDEGRETGLQHYFLGGSEETLDALKRSCTELYPGVQIAGCYSPPFRDLTAAEKAHMVRDVAASGADVVWIGLGTPKQDYVAAELAAALPVVTVAVGAAFDFTAGTKAEAPAWLRGSGMEWVFRLATEPRRLWRRYLFGNLRFTGLALRHFLRRPASAPVNSR
jgi:N-acetylglucosaminyldiphosphoundecaprenol N-acetyl-beta-D-mannosaminyltransferase